MDARHPALFITLPGLAPWCAAELRELGLSDAAARTDGGGAWVEATVADPTELARCCWLGRLVVRGLWLCDAFDVEPGAAALDALRERIHALGNAVARWIPPGRTFAGRSVRRGAHEYTSVQLEHMTGAGAFRAVESVWGTGPTVNLTDPDVTVRTDVCDGRAVMGIDFVGERGLDRRPTPGPHHKAGCSPVVAAALLRIAGWSPDDVLLDPMCGGGSIAVEALSIAAGLPAGWWRRGTLAFERLVTAEGEPAVDPGLTQVDRPELGGRRPRIVCNDAAGRALDLTRGAVGHAGFGADAVELHQHDVAELAGALEAGTIDCIAVNPPYGIKMGNTRSLKHAYAGLARCAAELLRPGGAMAAILPGPGRLQRPAEAAGLASDVVTTVQIRDIAAGILRVARAG
jgi:tRNA (guanine6-N2)-methyltransferase